MCSRQGGCSSRRSEDCLNDGALLLDGDTRGRRKSERWNYAMVAQALPVTM